MIPQCLFLKKVMADFIVQVLFYNRCINILGEIIFFFYYINMAISKDAKITKGNILEVSLYILLDIAAVSKQIN